MILSGILLYFLDRLFFFVVTADAFVLPLNTTFGLFSLTSILVMLVVDVVFIKNKDVVGMTFLLVTSIKVIALVIVAKYYHILEENTLEKWHFFALFLIFLFLETLLTGLRLNKTKF